MTRQCSKGSLRRNRPPYWTSISVNKGAHFHTLGFSNEGKITLYPEEAAFLVSRNALVVTDENDNELQFQDFCELLCDNETDGWITFEKYQVYAYLKRLGYIVQRSKSFSVPPTILESDDTHTRSTWDLFCNKLSYFIYKGNDMPLVWDYKDTSYRKYRYTA